MRAQTRTSHPQSLIRSLCVSILTVKVIYLGMVGKRTQAELEKAEAVQRDENERRKGWEGIRSNWFRRELRMVVTRKEDKRGCGRMPAASGQGSEEEGKDYRWWEMRAALEKAAQMRGWRYEVADKDYFQGLVAINETSTSSISC